MKANAYLIAAAFAVFCAFGDLAVGQYAGGMGPMGYPPPGGFGSAPAMPVNYGTPPMLAAPITPASAYGPLPAPVVPGMAAEEGKGPKGGKSDCGPCVAVYGDFIYLRPRDAEVAYASAINGAISSAASAFPVQVSPIGVVDMDFQPGFRLGFRYNLNPRNALGAECTFFKGNTQNSIATQIPNAIRSIVSHPGTDTASHNFLLASAEYDLSHDVVDFNYYNLLSCADDYQLTGVYGVRVMQHEQRFQADFAGSGTETVMTDIDFYGAGARAGLEYDKFISRQWLIYGKGFGNLIPGEFRADYDQSQSYDSVVVDTGWKAGRVVTIWDLELGLAWVSKCGNYRFNAGYMYSAWTNMVQTDEWIAAVKRNDFIDMDSSMTYDGAVARFEARY